MYTGNLSVELNTSDSFYNFTHLRHLWNKSVLVIIAEKDQQQVHRLMLNQ